MIPRQGVRGLLVLVLAVLAAVPWPLLAGPSAEVVNGRPVPTGAYPFVVSLQRPSKKAHNAYENHVCGGALVDATHVVTAAHCVWDGSKAIPPTQLRVLAGATRLPTRIHRRGDLLTVRRITVHPKYRRSAAYDIAVLELKRPAPETGFISLPPAGDARIDRTGTNATVAGWGSTRRIGGSGGKRTKYPREMQQTTVPIAPTSECTRSYREAGIRNLNLRAALCAGGSHRDSCYGDSGGPLFVGGSDAPVQIGVVSWGIGCGRTDYPGIYTRLTNPSVNAFILRHLKR